MNREHPEKNPQRVDDGRLDRLVDGELNDADRCELLLRLEREPGGWRRCALAFLEAQCWRRHLRDACPPKTAATPAVTASPSPAAPLAPDRTRQRWLNEHLGTLLAMAASFLVALALGTSVRDLWRWPAPHAGQPDVDQVAVEGNRPPRTPLNNPAVVPVNNNAAGPQAATPWRMVTLAAPESGDQSSQPIRLPAIEQEQLDPNWLGSFPAALPPEVLKALERTGYEVRQQRQLMPVPLKDGRRLVVPVDQVDVHYVGNRAQ